MPSRLLPAPTLLSWPNAKDVTDPRSELGIRTDKSFAMTDGILTLRGRVALTHDYDADRSIAVTFQALPGESFVVNGAVQASDSVLTTASVEKKCGSRHLQARVLRCHALLRRHGRGAIRVVT
jgi:hypothetical protein